MVQRGDKKFRQAVFFVTVSAPTLIGDESAMRRW
jgi:hypothetical protein